MSNLLIARTFYPFQKCCADAIFVPHYFEISIFHMKRPKIKTQSWVYLATAEICVMVGSSSPFEESFLASERFNVELFFLHCYVKIVFFSSTAICWSWSFRVHFTIFGGAGWAKDLPIGIPPNPIPNCRLTFANYINVKSPSKEADIYIRDKKR